MLLDGFQTTIARREIGVGGVGTITIVEVSRSRMRIRRSVPDWELSVIFWFSLTNVSDICDFVRRS